MTDKPNNVLPFVRPVPVQVTYPYSADAAFAHPDVTQFVESLSDDDRAALLADRSVFVWAEFAASILTAIKFEVGRVIRKAVGVPGFGTADWQAIGDDNPFGSTMQWASAGKVQTLPLARHTATHCLTSRDIPSCDGKLPTAQQWANNINATNRNLIAEKPALAERIAAGHLVGAAQRAIWLRALLRHGVIYRADEKRYMLDTGDAPPELDNRVGPSYPAALRRYFPVGTEVRFV